VLRRPLDSHLRGQSEGPDARTVRPSSKTLSVPSLRSLCGHCTVPGQALRLSDARQTYPPRPSTNSPLGDAQTNHSVPSLCSQLAVHLTAVVRSSRASAPPLSLSHAMSPSPIRPFHRLISVAMPAMPAVAPDMDLSAIQAQASQHDISRKRATFPERHALRESRPARMRPLPPAVQSLLHGRPRGVDA
jgi:hypothetical protein